MVNPTSFDKGRLCLNKVPGSRAAPRGTGSWRTCTWIGPHQAGRVNGCSGEAFVLGTAVCSERADESTAFVSAV